MRFRTPAVRAVLTRFGACLALGLSFGQTFAEERRRPLQLLLSRKLLRKGVTLRGHQTHLPFVLSRYKGPPQKKKINASAPFRSFITVCSIFSPGLNPRERMPIFSSSTYLWDVRGITLEIIV